MLDARTYAEAHLYMDLQPCRCGALGFDRDYAGVLESPDETIRIRFEGVCATCGRTRGFTFRLPAEAQQSTAGFSHESDGPSTLIDAAQWYAVSAARSAFLRSVQQNVNPAEAWSDPEAWDDMVEGLSDAAEAARESARFVPPGAAEVPAEAIWTDGGRAALESLGGRLDATTIERRYDECRSDLEEFVQRHLKPEGWS